MQSQLHTLLMKLTNNKNINIEFNNLTNVFKYKDIEDNKTDNLYLLAGVKKINKRAGDKDIEYKNYFVVDLDIRKAFISFMGFDCDNESIINEAKEIKEFLDKNSILGKYSEIVFTGNGLHIYYILDKIYKVGEDISIDEYSEGVREFYKRFEDYFGVGHIKPDYACSNIGRITRLPYSINQKNVATVEILYSQDIKLDFDLADMGKKAIEKKKEEIRKEQEKRMRHIEENKKLDKIIYGNNKTEKIEAIFDMIDKIPCYLVSEKLLPQFPFNKNFKNFDSDNPKKHRYTAFYYLESMNAIINGGSHHYNFGNPNSGYSPSVLVRKHLDLSWGEVMVWFKDNFNLIYN